MIGVQARKSKWQLPFAAMAVLEVPLSRLDPNSRHPRRDSSEADLELLAESLRQHGQLTPLFVRKLGDDQYEIITGVRRWRAASLAGLTTLWCQVFEIDEDQAFVLSLIEHLQHQQLTPLEEAYAYQHMLDQGIARNRADIARLLGITRPRITQKMKLLELDAATLDKLKTHPDTLTELHGRLLLQIHDLSERHRMAEEAIADSLSTSQLAVLIQQYLDQKEIARWHTTSTHPLRIYRVASPGLHIMVNFQRANLQQALVASERMAHLIRQVLQSAEASGTLSFPARCNEIEGVKSI